MIKTALVALTVVGCDCDARLCEFISETPPQFETVEACEAAVTAQVMASSRFDYPLVSGICRAVPTEGPRLVSAPRGDGPDGGDRFDTSTPAPSMTDRIAAGTQTIFRRTANGYALARGGVSHVADGALSLLRRSAAFMPSVFTGF
jgi:hypothetical protein